MNYAHLLASIFALFTILGALAIVGTFTWFSHEFRKPGPLPQNTVIEIASGSSLAKISDELLSTGAISHALVFKIGVRIKGDASALKAGEYQISSAASMHDIMQLMQNGKTIMRSFTIPEGKTSYEIVRILNAVEGLNGEVMEVPAEGSLLPETYHFQKGDTRAEKIVRMQSAMKETVEELWPGRDENLPFETKEEAITLASIVEKETAVTEERAKVAGVFINRLRRGIALQTDPTVIYAITKGEHQNEGKGPLGRRLLKKDLEFDSPYNTYKYPGLPPGPIANPGRASIAAVLHPEEHDYIYFVADGTGGHAFGKTLAEHNANVAKWRKIRRAQNK